MRPLIQVKHDLECKEEKYPRENNCEKFENRGARNSEFA